MENVDIIVKKSCAVQWTAHVGIDTDSFGAIHLVKELLYEAYESTEIDSDSDGMYLLIPGDLDAKSAARVRLEETKDGALLATGYDLTGDEVQPTNLCFKIGYKLGGSKNSKRPFFLYQSLNKRFNVVFEDLPRAIENIKHKMNSNNIVVRVLV